MYYIYAIKNVTNNWFYVGQTNDLGKRFRQHINFGLRGYENLKNHHPDKKGLYIDMYTLGIENFIFKVVEKVDSDINRIINEREEYWIRKCNAVENGYNTMYNADTYKEINKGNIKSDFNYIDYSNQCGKEKMEMFKKIKEENKQLNDKGSKRKNGNSNIQKKEKKSKKQPKRTFVYIIKKENEVISLGQKSATDKEEIDIKVREYYNYLKPGTTSIIGTYIYKNGGIDKFDIHILGSFALDDNENMKRYKQDFFEKYKDKFVHPEVIYI